METSWLRPRPQWASAMLVFLAMTGGSSSGFAALPDSRADGGPASGPAAQENGAARDVHIGPSEPAGVASACAIGSWQAAAPINVGRSRASLVYADLNGRFYLLGGEGLGGDRNLPIEAYDPIADSWTQRAPLATGVSNAGAAAIGQYVFVAGGFDGTSGQATMQRYNIVGNSVSLLAPMPAPVSAHAVVAFNNRIHVLGGSETGVAGNTHRIYNVASNSWQEGAPVPVAVQYAAAVTDGSYIYLMGGNTGDLATVQRLNPATNTWTQIADMGTGRGGPAGFFDGRQVWAVGGGWATYQTSTEFWNGSSWQAGPDMAVGVRTTGAAFGSGIGLRASGWNGAYETSAELLPIDCPPPPPPPECTIGSWQPTGSIAVPRSRTGLAYSEATGRFYLFGGEASGGDRDLPVEEFDPSTGLWTSRALLGTGISNSGAAAVGQYIYVPGGFTGTVAVADMQRYDPIADTVANMAPMPVGNYGHAVVAQGGRIYVMGGSETGAPGFTHHIYDVASNSWSIGPPLLHGVHYASAASDGQYIYLMGGYVLGGTPADLLNVQRYDPASGIWTEAPIMDAGRGGGAAFHDGRNIWMAGGGWSTYLTATEYFDGYRWRVGPAMNLGARTLGAAYGNGLAVKAAGWNGGYMAAAETLQLSCVADRIFFNGFQMGQ